MAITSIRKNLPVRVALALGLTLTMALPVGFITGCGGGAPRAKKKSAKKQIEEARDAMSRGAGWEAAGDTNLDSAISAYADAEDQISSGRKIATGTERRTLEDMQSDVAAKLISLRKAKDERDAKLKAEKEAEAAAKEQKKKDAAAKLAAAQGGAKTADPTAIVSKEERERLKKEADKKAQAKAAEEAASLLSMREDKSKVSSKDDEEEGEEDVVIGDGAAAGGEGGKKPAAKKSAGPFKTIPKDGPAVSVDRLDNKIDHTFAYFQIYNKNEGMGKRIGRVMVTFKDKTNGVMGDTPYVFEYKLYDKNAKDPTDQPNGKAAVVGSSHEVPAGGVLQLIAVGHFPGKASNTKKAAIQVFYEDGTTESGDGPQAAAVNQATIPGL